jgi:hypothetical protein
MVDSAAAVPAWARAVDAGRRGPKGDSAGGTGPFGPWRSGAAERVQAGAGVVESAIYRDSRTSVRASTCTPRSMSAASVCSSGWWLIPPALGTKIIPTGTWRPRIIASW